MLALVRPDSWNLPLFLHVLGAVLTFGAVGTIALLGFAAQGRVAEQAAVLRRTAWWTGLAVLVPAFILMRATAQWIADKEYPDDGPGWMDVGFLVTEPGAILLLIMLILAGLSVRRPGLRLAAAVPWLATVYLAALGVAWFAMSAKPGS